MDERFQFEDESTLRVDDVLFRLGMFAADEWKRAPDDAFLMYKPQSLVRMFDAFFSSRAASLQPRNVFEIGIWDGGSVAFWFEYFRPAKHVAIDRIERGDGEYFRRYRESKGLGDRLKTYWGIDQADGERLAAIVRDEFTEPLDLVIDDGSHLPDETRASFEALFPLLRPGGLYVVEDWNWELNPRFRAPEHAWAARDGLVGLVTDLVKVTGSGWDAISELTVRTGFFAAERARWLPRDARLDLRARIAELPRKLESR